ncbi:TonB-dependent receptor [Sphingobium sp. BS19]|uniref:TonB-dependent receptor n=1 Tax=Sphingobium sp. BS19 TaxID=3018973 RepID=UPI0022EE98F7|nr:TonB-dependent receptor [Sphingobium sp. BS19]GLI98915.1 TonB-dependent receptor [Sphingobium sp. BS19]
MTKTTGSAHLRASVATRAIVAVGLALIATPLQAQDVAPTAADESGEGDVIVVNGTRPIAESESAALVVQRNSDSLVAVAASDSVGRLPDQNIAQAAGRLPGVAVQRDQGQARYISLRGAPINWTTLSIDGIAIVSPEGRDTRYDSIPSAIASQIIVRKAVTPDMTGETVAGNVDVKTRSAFDYTGFHIAGKLGGGYVELGKRQEYEGQLVVSNRWDTGIGEIGLLASGSYYQRDMITDNFETDWEQVSQDVQPGAADRIWAKETENKLYRLTRKNYSYSGRLDWKPSADHRIFVESIFTTFTDDEARDNYIFDLDDKQSDNKTTAGCTITPSTSATTSGYADLCIGNTPLKGTVYGIDINQRATLRAFEQSIFTNTLGGDHEFGEGWKLGWRLNYTRAKDDRSVVGEARYESPSTRTARPTVAYDLSDPQLAKVQLFRTLSGGGRFSAGAPVTNIDDFARPLTSLTSSDFVDITKAYTAKFDLSRDMAMLGGEGTITIGGRFDQRTKEANEAQLSINATQAAALGISSTFLPDSLDTPFKGKIPLGYTFRYFDMAKMRANVEKAKTVATYNTLYGNFYNVREQVYSAYVMGRVAYDWGSILGGARIEHIKNRGQAFVNGSAATPIQVENDLTLVYPSLHFNFDVATDKKLRLSFNSGAARPDYDQLRPNFTFNDSNLTVSGGNPDAKPERAFGVDGYFEWYVQPQGYVMVGAFYKKVKDVLFDDSRTFNSDVLNSGTVDRSQYLFSTIVNGGDGYIYGAEAAVQQQLEPYTQSLGLPDWMGGFGISANVTFNKSSATAPNGSKFSLPGTSDVVYNIGGYYEKYGLSMRLNYQKRTAWLDSLGAAADGGAQYWAADDEMDFSIRYAITPNFEIYADASNLLNQPGRRYVQSSKYTIEWERFGRRYTGGVRFNF